MARAREVRIATAEAQAQVIFSGEYAERDPGAVLLGAVADMDAVVQKLKDRIRLADRMTATDLEALGQWIDRAARAAKVALDAGVAERAVRLEEQRASMVVDLLRGVLADVGIDPGRPDVVRIVSSRLRALGGAG